MEIKEAGGNKAAPPAGVLLPRCRLCGEVPEEGIRGGIKIRKTFICRSCEEQIVSLPAGGDEYLYLLEELKKIW